MKKRNAKDAFYAEQFNSRRDVKRGWDRWGKARLVRRAAKVERRAV